MLNNTNKFGMRNRQPGSASLIMIVSAVVVLAVGMMVFVFLAGKHFASERSGVAGNGPGVAINLTPDVKARQVKPFVFTDENGESFDSSSLAGDYWLVDFIFTNCAGPCPIMTSEMAKIERDYAEVKNLRLVSISVDPKRDTPEVLKAYGAQYGADFNRWIFLTGEFNKVQQVAQDIFLLAVTNPANDKSKSDQALPATGSIVHSTKLVLVSPDGTIINWFTGTDAEEITRLRKVLDGVRDAGSVSETGSKLSNGGE